MKIHMFQISSSSSYSVHSLFYHGNDSFEQNYDKHKKLQDSVDASYLMSCEK